MPFGNPILGGTTLIREAEQSENYVQGQAGWRLARNGNAEVNNLVSRGYASGPSAAYDTLSANDEFYYQGTELSNFFNDLPQGVVAYGETDGQSNNFTTTATKYATVYYDSAIPGHVYKFTVLGAVQISGGYSGTIVYYESNPNQYVSKNSELIYRQYHEPAGGGASDRPMFMSGLIKATTSRVAIGLYAYINSNSYTAYLRCTGTQKLILTLEDKGAGSTRENGITLHHWGSTPPPAYTKHTFNKYATLVSSREQNGDVLSDGTNERAYQGDYGGFGGNRFTDFFFDTSDMHNAHQISRLDIYLYMEHTYESSGTTVELGYVATNNKYYGPYKSVDFVANQGKWISLLNTTIEAAILNGTLSYMRMGPAPNHSVYYYCYANGHISSAGPGVGPKLRATYYK
jgi:hypothetical protein